MKKKITAHYVTEPDPVRMTVEEAKKLYSHTEERIRRLEQTKRNELARYLWQKRKAQQQAFREKQRSFEQLRSEQLTEEYEKKHREEVKTLEEDCFELCLSLCKEILQKDISTHSSYILDRLKEHLGQSQRVVNISISTMEPEKELLQSALSDQAKVGETAELRPGSAEITTDSGSITIDWKDEFKRQEQILRTAFQRDLAKAS